MNDLGNDRTNGDLLDLVPVDPVLSQDSAEKKSEPREKERPTVVAGERPIDEGTDAWISI